MLFVSHYALCCCVQATIVCDVLVLYVVRARNYYRDSKYQNVQDPHSDYEIINDKSVEQVRS